RDELTGEDFALEADVVVNATGAWTDRTNAALGAGTGLMGGTKGSHVVLDAPELLAACGGREIFFEHTDGRIVLIYPLGDRVLVGTTDIDAGEDLDPVCTDAEVDYFFELIRHVFPTVAVRREQIVYTFSGVRPLPRHGGTAPGFVSRDYRIERAGGTGGEPVRLSLVGGKWTTFRAVSEDLADRVLAELGSRRRASTAELPIGGGAGFPADGPSREAWLKARLGAGVDAARAEVLLERYGARAEQVIAFLRAGEDRLLRSTRELSDRELAYMARHEQVGHVVDVLIRRTSLAFRGLVTRELVGEVATVLAPHLGWDPSRVEAEAEHALRTLSQSHRVEADELVG
ncbi:MAG: FAD-dependent oxidoreductase, partial [Sinomonas sp.]|nr:FAD-dependent oxidoreductase [Sinomonas sp.]